VAIADAKGIVDVVSGSCAGLIALKAKAQTDSDMTLYFLFPVSRKLW